MTGLLASEFRRLRSRRLVKVVAALAVLTILVSGAIVFLTQEYELKSLAGTLMGTSLALVAIGWVIGASSVGADWHSGIMTTLLTWEPRRGRVIWAKVIACLVSVFVLAILLQTLLAFVLILDAAARGSTVGVLLSRSVGAALRSALLAAFCAGLGFGIASVGRNTAAALGVGFGYMLVVENVVRGFKPHWSPWLLTDNAVVFILNDPRQIPDFRRSALGAGLYLAALAGAILVGAAAAFRARDVT